MAIKSIHANKENGRVSIGAFEKYYNEVKPANKTIVIGDGDGAFEVLVAPTIGLQDSVSFVNVVLNSVFDEEGNYRGLLREYGVRHATIMMFTNMTLPNDVNKEFDLLFGTDVYERIVECIDQDFYAWLLDSAEDHIEYEIRHRMSSAAIEVNQAVAAINQATENNKAFIDAMQKLAGPELFELAKKLQSSAGTMEDAISEVKQKIEEIKPDEGSGE